MNARHWSRSVSDVRSLTDQTCLTAAWCPRWSAPPSGARGRGDRRLRTARARQSGTGRRRRGSGRRHGGSRASSRSAGPTTRSTPTGTRRSGAPTSRSPPASVTRGTVAVAAGAAAVPTVLLAPPGRRRRGRGRPVGLAGALRVQLAAEVHRALGGAVRGVVRGPAGVRGAGAARDPARRWLVGAGGAARRGRALRQRPARPGRRRRAPASAGCRTGSVPAGAGRGGRRSAPRRDRVLVVGPAGPPSPGAGWPPSSSPRWSCPAGWYADRAAAARARPTDLFRAFLVVGLVAVVLLLAGGTRVNPIDLPHRAVTLAR